MASKEELTEQLAITQKLATAVDQMARSMSRVESSYETQISAVEKLTKAIETLRGTDLSGLNNTKLDGFQKEIKETEKQTTTLTGRLKDMGNWMAKKFPSSAALGVAAISGFVQGLRNVVAIGKGVTGFLGGLVDALASVAASIIAIPFKMFNSLVDMAAAAGGGANELAEALRKMRIEFGSLSGPTNKAIIATSKSLQGFSDTGLSAFRVFGNLAQRLEYMIEIAKAMGGTFAQFTDEFAKNGGALLAYQKGLGITAEEMRGWGQLALSMGRKLSDVMKETTKYTYELGDAFKLDAKLISKDMSKALQDVKHFGGATVKQIAEASTYARKLGLELDKITGTLDAFETFDSAAENAAKLSQSFGATVDAFKLMDAQSPAEQVDMLRKSLLAAGKSAETMTRQELRLLAQTTGLDEATAKMAFSAQNQGVSLDEIKKKSAEAEKKTLTQAQAMAKLADAIERLVQSGGGQSGGFFEQFFKGFLGGIQASKEFREIIWNIKRSLQLVYFEGVKLGRAFVEMFPGVKEFLQGIADFFKPEKFKRLVGGVVDIFKDWMKGLTDPGGKASFADLMTKLKEHFFDFFNMQEGSGKKMLEGFKTVFKTVTKIVAEGIKWASDKVGEGITFIVDLLSGKKDLSAIGSAAGGGMGFLAEVLVPLADALTHAWKVIAPKLWELVKILAHKLFEFLKSDQVINTIKPALPYLAAVLFGPAFTRSLLAAGTTALGKAAISLLTGGSTKKVMEEVTKKAAGQVMEASKKVTEAGVGGGEGMKQVGAVNKASGEAIDKGGKGDKWGVQDAVKLGLKLVAIATALAIGGVEMAIAITIMRKIMKSGGIEKPDDVYPQILALGAMVVAAIPLMLALKIADKVGKASEIIKGGAVIALAVGIVGLTAGILAGLLGLISTPSMLDAVGTLMLKMSLVFLAMVPLIMASMAVGALASGPQAIALAAAAVGLGVIGVAVAQMVGMAVLIIQELSKLQVDKTFQQKIDAFLGVMKAIQAFTDSTVRVIEMMQPSLLGFLTGTEEKFTSKIEAASKLIKEMVGQSGQPGGLIGMIETVKGVVAQLGAGGPQIVQGAQIFASVMEAVSTALKALVPPDAFFEAGNSFLQRLVDPAWNYSSLTADIQNYSQKMQQQLMGLLQGPDGKGGILALLEKLVTINVPDPNKAKVVADMVTGLANVMKIITPDAETIKSMQTSGVDTSFAWGLLKFDNKKSNVKPEDIAKLMDEKSKGVQEIIDSITKGPLKSVLDSAATISPEKFANVKIIGDIMKTVVDLATALSSTKGQKVETIDKETTKTVTDLIPNVAEAIKGIGDNIGPLITSLVGVVKTLPSGDAGFMKNMETATKLFAMLGEIPKLAQGISDVSKSSGGTGDINTEPLFKSVATIAIFFWKLVNEKGWGTSRPVLLELIANIKAMGTVGLDATGAQMQKTVDVINNLFKGITTLGSSLKVALAQAPNIGADTSTTVSTMLSNISSTLAMSAPHINDISTKLGSITGFKDLGTKLEDYVSFLNKAAKAAKVDGLAAALTAVADMVKLANELDTTLNQGIKIDTPVKLAKLAKGVGLGGKYNYTVTNKEVVINMNVQVTMNVDEVEKVLILRKNSFVRDRINLALGEKQAPAYLPEDPSSPVVIPAPTGAK